MGVRRFIYISTIGVNGVQTNPGTPFSEADLPNPNNAYATSKLDAELGLQLLAESTGLEVVIIRAPLVYGPNAKGKFKLLVGAVKSGWPLPFGSIQNKRSLVSLGNLVDFIVTCANSPAAANQVFLVSDGHDVSISELVKGLASAAGVRARQIPVPKSILQLVGFVFGQSMAVQGLCGDLQINMSKARDLLGWSPPISFEDGLRRAIADDVEQ
jgi:nucleoside-diphosphate-sugar epimerase